MDTKILELRRRVLGPENPETLWSFSSIAHDYKVAHNYAQAAAYDAKTAELRAWVLGPDNPLTLESLSALASDYRSLGDYANVESVYRKSCEAQPNNAVPLNSLAWFLLTVPDPKLRRPEEALELSRKSVKLAGENAGMEYGTLGLALVRNRQWDEAIATMNKSVELNKSAEPTDFFILALAYHGLGSKADAERNLTQGADLTRKLGRSDSDTIALWSEAAKSLGKPGPPKSSNH